MLGLAPSDTTWGVMVSCPIFVQNLLDRLAPPTGNPTGVYRTRGAEQGTGFCVPRCDDARIVGRNAPIDGNQRVRQRWVDLPRV